MKRLFLAVLILTAISCKKKPVQELSTGSDRVSIVYTPVNASTLIGQWDFYRQDNYSNGAYIGHSSYTNAVFTFTSTTYFQYINSQSLNRPCYYNANKLSVEYVVGYPEANDTADVACNNTGIEYRLTFYENDDNSKIEKIRYLRKK